MEVKTKFNAGDSVFFIDNKTKKAVCRKIDYISVTADKRVRVAYAFVEKDSYKTEYVEEEFCFATKQELLNYITSDL
jgi:hypothetical protein